jgi:hypothetical protein
MNTQKDPSLKIMLTNIAKNGDSNYKILYNTKWKEVKYILKQGNVSSNDEEKVKKVNREVIELTKEEVREKMKIELDKYFKNKKLKQEIIKKL